MALDLEGWIKNDGLLKLPEALTVGQAVDVIHRDGDLLVGCLAGKPNSFAQDFSIDWEQYEDIDGEFWYDFGDGDILYFRPTTGREDCDRTEGEEILEALQ